MSALQKLIEKQARGETMTSLEFAVYWCSDMVASVNAADELATLRAERDEAARLLKPLAKIPCLENFDDDQLVDTSILAEDIRAARAFLASIRNGEETGA